MILRQEFSLFSLYIYSENQLTIDFAAAVTSVVYVEQQYFYFLHWYLHANYVNAV